MERLIQARNALDAFAAILEQPFSAIVRDAAIQRFEFSAEAVWKAAREWLYRRESVEANHPIGVYRTLFRLGYIDEALCVRLIELIDDRNRTSHAYIEALAQAVFEKLPAHLESLQQVLAALETRAGPDEDQAP